MRLGGEVLIIGAGIGGLTLAAALRQRGFSCRVFERTPELKPVGAGILVQPSALRALHTLGLDAKVAAAGQDVRLGLVTTERGRVLQRTSLAFLAEQLGIGTVAIHRGRLQEVLLAGASGVPLVKNAELVRYDVAGEGVTAHFSDGSRVEGALLVGADGLRSVVRRQVLGETPLRYAGYTSWRGVADVAGTVPPEEVTEMWGPGSRFGFATMGGGQTYWFAVSNATEGEREPNSLEVVSERFSHWAEPVPKLLASTRADHVIRTDIHDRAPVPRWSSGPVTLLGDAAHPTTPTLGQGGSMALEDAVVLAHALERSPSVAEALADYERRRVARTARIVEASFRFGKIAQLRNPIGIFLRNLVLRLTPEGVVQRELARAAEFSLEEAAMPAIRAASRPTP
ncbi:MAG TPA: FAD-dependent monooxygenase [Polyangiaceae bacterium]|nr:FAD-dependent monooxygenase [Polyangiaceae bacterium]